MSQRLPGIFSPCMHFDHLRQVTFQLVYPRLTLLHFLKCCVHVLHSKGVFDSLMGLWSHTETLRWTECLCQGSAHGQMLRRITLSSYVALAAVLCAEERKCAWCGLLETSDFLTHKRENGIGRYTHWHTHTSCIHGAKRSLTARAPTVPLWQI